MSSSASPSDSSDRDNPEGTPVIEVTMAAPPDAVWQAMRDLGQLKHWHGWEYDGLDDEIELIYFREAVETDPGRAITLSGGDHVDLLPADDTTRVRLTRAPIPDDPDWAAYYDDVTEGWITFLHQLKFALEHHPGESRRTLFYSGRGDRPEVSDLVTGTPWFRTDHQQGIRVPAWGDGLLVTAHDPVRGTAMAVLTTYGLDDETLAELDGTWQPWWEARYARP